MPNNKFRQLQGTLPRRRRRGTQARMPRQPIGEQDLATTMVPGPDAPPQVARAPPVTRKIRINQPYVGAAIGYDLFANDLSVRDQQDYGTSGARYSRVQISKVEVWFHLDTPPSMAGVPAPELQLTDSFSTSVLVDNTGLGIDWAHIAMRPCLNARMTQLPYNDTANKLANVAVGASAGSSGTIVIDVTTTFS